MFQPILEIFSDGDFTVSRGNSDEVNFDVNSKAAFF